MKHIKPFLNFKLNEEKEDNLDVKTKDFDFSDDILDEYSFKKVDYYYLKDKVDEMLVKEMYDMVSDNEYRAFATFVDNIKYFEELPCTLIALVNYPAERFNKRTLIKSFESVINLEYVDEVEFPWSLKYIDYGVEFWREIVLNFSNKGFRLRPMVEFGIYSNDDVKKVIEFFKKINILTIMTSSGLYPDITTFERWEELKDLIPNKWIVKIGGVLTIGDINKFIKSDVDLASTTISFVAKYGDELGLDKNKK